MRTKRKDTERRLAAIKVETEKVHKAFRDAKEELEEETVRHSECTAGFRSSMPPSPVPEAP